MTFAFDPKTSHALLEPGYYMERFHWFVTLMQPKVNPGVFWGAESTSDWNRGTTWKMQPKVNHLHCPKIDTRGFLEC